MFLRPTGSPVIAIVRACGTLASNTIVSREAGAGSSLAVAGTLVGALNPRMNIVSVNNLTDPSMLTRTCTLRAIGTSPLILSI